MGKVIFLIICFYFLTLLETSFFPHLTFGLPAIFAGGINLILIVVILINLFTPHHSWWGMFSVFLGGFLLDIFSENFLGFWILILLAIAIFIKFVLRKYLQFPIFKFLA